MTQDVQQWLNEIQSLRHRLAELSQDRADAYEQASRWQQSYQTEAEQRRKDVRRLQTVIYHLNQENQRLKQQVMPASSDPALVQEPQLQAAIAECDRLAKSLAQEQADHGQTRQTLMSALEDVVEQLERERKRQRDSRGRRPQASSLNDPQPEP